MVVILCDSWKDVRDCYDLFITFLEENDSYAIKETDNSGFGVFLEDDLWYVFTCYQLEGVMKKNVPNADFVDEQSFFESVIEYLYGPDGYYV